MILGVSGRKGDSEDTLQLMWARAMVLRDYLPSAFRIDDRRVKTLGVAKGDHSTSDTGTIEIVIYPAGTSVATRE